MIRYHRHATERAFGVQHGEDEFYYRPLVIGRNLFSYVAHIPPGGGVPPYPIHAKRNQIEHSMYILTGTLKVQVCGEWFTMVPHTAVRIPAGEVVVMDNQGETPVSIYMAYTPSPWGPSSPIEDRVPVTTHDEMLAYFHARERKVWSPEVLNAMGGDLSARERSLQEWKTIWEAGQPLERPSGETDKERLWIALWEADGYQHWHKPHPPDDFWFRPLVCSEKHLTYVGQIPPNGGVPPSPEEAEFVEMCVYTLAGDLGCIILEGEEERRFVLPPHHAVYAPKHVPLGFWNEGSETASFLLTFTPNAPERDSVSAFREKAVRQYGWTLVSAPDLNAMLGHTLWLAGE
jgi:glyoxylate utilization-related uncharacterized protein